MYEFVSFFPLWKASYKSEEETEENMNGVMQKDMDASGSNDDIMLDGKSGEGSSTWIIRCDSLSVYVTYPKYLGKKA